MLNMLAISYILMLNLVFGRKLTLLLNFVEGQLLLGDVVISVETAVRQAKERGHALIDELRILLVQSSLWVLTYMHLHVLFSVNELLLCRLWSPSPGSKITQWRRERKTLVRQVVEELHARNESSQENVLREQEEDL